jgi:hypothetical protein
MRLNINTENLLKVMAELPKYEADQLKNSVTAYVYFHNSSETKRAAFSKDKIKDLLKINHLHDKMETLWQTV